MNQVILIHGMPDKEDYFDPSFPRHTDAHWFPWINEQFKTKGISLIMPEMPEPYEPKYDLWKSFFGKYNITEETILVGHSCGAGFLVRYFSEHPELKPKKIILVATWIDPEPSYLNTGFFEFEIDTSLTKRTDIIVFCSADDEESCVRSAKIIEEKLPDATYYRFANKGHFTEEDLGTKEFPELLEEVLK